MSNVKGPVVIVDGYSAARELVSELNLMDAQCLHIRSVETPPAQLCRTFDATPYRKDLGFLGAYDVAVASLASYNPSAVIAGSEPGVEYAEKLADLMNLPTNDPITAKARRNKHAMGSRIAEAGLLCARQRHITNEEDAISWAKSCGSWPIVIKPLESAGSDGVTICHSEEDIRAAVARTLDQKNLLGIQNIGLLAQTFLDGPQFLINTVSKDGEHHITDAWEMRGKPTGNPLLSDVI